MLLPVDGVCNQVWVVVMESRHSSHVLAVWTVGTILYYVSLALETINSMES